MRNCSPRRRDRGAGVRALLAVPRRLRRCCRDGRVVEGVNVENAAYPLGVCAERTAFSRAIAEGYGPGDFVVAAITASPCGGCRQWLAEMRVERVLFRNGGRIVEMTPDELLPEQFEL